MKGDGQPPQSIWEVQYALCRRELILSMIGDKQSRSPQVVRRTERRAYRLVQVFAAVRSSFVSFGGKYVGTFIHNATPYPEDNLSADYIRQEVHWAIRRIARDMPLDFAVEMVNALLQGGNHYISSQNRTAVQYLANSRVMAYAPNSTCRVAPIAQRGVREYLKAPVSHTDVLSRRLSKHGALAEAEAILASAR